ncbi:hypothetical protein [Streptomyces niger]|uniref:hypothetical protein n=1 Tax=Streptomyces niger TaxID=66373 RepID=UPI00069B618F|nr:hypothetical protein [Streptomyces niger]
MPNARTPKAATADDAPSISRSLARAFDDDPLMCRLLPDATTRGERLERWFTTLFRRQNAPHGRCELTGSGAAVSAEIRPHADGPPLWPMWRPARSATTGER